MAAAAADAKDLSKGAQAIASSGAPIKEAHANKKRDKDGNEIRLEELANFNPETFLDNHRTFLKRLHIASVTCMIVSAVILLLAITLCITFLILAGSEIKRIEELKSNEKNQKIKDWKMDSCQTCYKLSSSSSDDNDNTISANMTGSLENNSKEIETAPCEYNISKFWECNGFSDDNNNSSNSDKYYCFKNY